MPRPSAQKTRDSGGKIRVLVVDDDEDVVTSLRDILVAVGYEVDTAYSGAEALERVRERRPDCVLMDIKMPGMNGVEAYREIKRVSPESFVIFMTAYSTSSLVDEARREGAIEVFAKPFDLQPVLRLIEETAAKTPVLVVDDDSSFCRTLGEALSAYAFDVHVAHGVDQAIMLFMKEPRRVVILDMKLNGRTGLDALLVIKELNPRAIVILMTAFMELREDVERGLEMDAVAFLMKPFEVDDLIRTIRKVVAAKR